MSAEDSPLQRAKARLSIPALWQLLGLPGTPAKSCKSPFREDHSASFSIYAGGSRWRDFGNSDGGDAVDFVARALDISLEDAARKLIELAGILPPIPIERHEANWKDDAGEREAKRRQWPIFEQCTSEEITRIADLRGLSIEGVSIVTDRGLLFCADTREGRAWILTDSHRRNAQARLLSGRLWAGGMKAKTLPGSESAWPIGLREAESCRGIALVEGGPDFLAAMHLAWCAGVENLIAPVAMLGASNQIPEASLPFFAGKNVRIFMHEDEAGRAAGCRWACRLAKAGARVDGFEFEGLVRHDGHPVKDLNDFAHLSVDEWESRRKEAEAAFDFVKDSSQLLDLGAEQAFKSTAPVKRLIAKLAA